MLNSASLSGGPELVQEQKLPLVLNDTSLDFFLFYENTFTTNSYLQPLNSYTFPSVGFFL